jgi:hypothetical protein
MNTGYRTVGGWNLFKVAALTLGIACAPMLQLAAQATTLDAGTVLPVRLNSALSSKDAQKGDTFTATVRTDSDMGNYGLPDGTRVEGVVRMARPHRDNDPGVLDLEFRRLKLPSGESYPIEGSLIGLDNKSVRKTSDGKLIATPDHTNKRLTYVGYGAGAGLIVGALTKHTVEDTLIGGGLGYLFGALEKGHSQARDVNLKSGTEIGVRLDQRLTLSSYDDHGRPPVGDDAARYHRTQDDNRDHPDRTGDNAEIGVLLGDRNVNFDSNAQPIMSRGVVLIPVRPVLDAMHVPFRYDRDAKVIRATGDRGTVRLSLGSSVAVMGDGRRVRLDAPAQRLNGTIYAPMRFLELATGRDVKYDEGSRTVIIDQGDDHAPHDDNSGR